MTPNRARFIRSTKSCQASSETPVSRCTSDASSDTPATRVRRIHRASKSLPGLICKNRSAESTLSVRRTSTTTQVRSARPRGTNMPWGNRL